MVVLGTKKGAVWAIDVLDCISLKRVQTHTMTTYAGAKINWKMGPNWPQNRSPGECGTDLRSIFQILRK